MFTRFTLPKPCDCSPSTIVTTLKMTLLSSLPFILAFLSLTVANAVPRDLQDVLQPNTVAQDPPLITPAPASPNWLPTKTIKRRGIISDITADTNSILSDLGSDIPSFVASGIPNFFQDFPTGDKVRSSLGLDDDQVKALPTQVLNIP